MLEKKTVLEVNTEEALAKASSSTVKGICPECGYLDVFPLDNDSDTKVVKCKRCFKDFTVPADELKGIKKQGE
jgi:hypothetical protein